MEESPFLKSDVRRAKTLLKEGKESQILFSEGTYQIEIADPEEKSTFWPFLQLDDHGKVLDCFCTCAKAEKENSCAHLAAAYLKIFNGKPEPLHIRFRESLWNQLCGLASRRHGYDPSVCKGNPKTGFEASSLTRKRLFYVRPLSQVGEKKLEEIMVSRTVETEETSLKFSNLSQQELLLWREGRPSHQLRFELSFWSDFAKWWMLLEDNGKKYEISFSDGKEKLPKWISFRFDHIVEAGFYIAEVNWSQVIPALATVRSPLPVYEFAAQTIQNIEYDEVQKAFLLDVRSIEEKREEPGKEVKTYDLGEWVYFPNKGFYPSRIDPLLQESVIPESKIASVLNKHAKIIQKYLKGTQIHYDSVKPRYLLQIDAEGNLVIEAYLFEPGDLQKAHSAFFGPWVYLSKKGFYLLENLLFSGVKKVISRNKVADFINRHRHWLNHYEGFQTHVSSLESHLTYSVTLEGVLRFEAGLDVSEELGEFVDFGEWIYIRGKGFYAKMSNRGPFFLKPGLTIPPKEISSFIHLHREELEQIQGFFMASCPLEKVTLNLFLNEQHKIVVRPAYVFKTPLLKERSLFFGDFIFTRGEGFSEIPAEQRLPVAYTQETVIDVGSEPYFIAYELDTLKPFISLIDPRLIKPQSLYLQINQVRRNERSKAGGWIFDLNYVTDVGKVSAFELWQALIAKKNYIFSSGGLIFLRQPRFNWLKSIHKRRWLKEGKQIRLTTLEWLRLNVFEEIREPEEKKSLALLEELKTFHSTLPIDLEGLKSHLRGYQEAGVRWLWFLYTQGLSGLLCDEMGLGKTHQAMGLIAAVTNSSLERPVKILVVCPTSVIFHWEDLLKRFFPKIRVLVFYGIARTLEAFEAEYDLLLTSYGTLRSEQKALSRLSFEIAIFDEVQTAKNSHSQTHKALRKIDAKMRLGLTGTPIENRLSELKALFDLVLPSYLPGEAAFRTLFETPIEKYHDAEKQMLLSRLIKPFILRRKKTEVLLELPEKIEEISYCPLSDEQKELYKKTVLSSKETLLKELKDESKPTPFLHVFALLTTLKQLCDHPVLITKQFDEYKRHRSGKWDLFVELLQEAQESGHKVVVFSQYLDMLDLIEMHLKEKGIGYAGIRGSTRNRKQQVDKFREDPQCAVFVASLQAAGVGIDLVAASIVIHYDRWWNPAKENQATDRVHRIGQNRGVQVFKLVTKGTIEEHIHNLIEKKKALAEGVIAYDDQEQIKHLDRSELIALLQMISQDI